MERIVEERMEIIKCIKKGDEIKKVPDSEAFKLVKDGWSFCNRKEWKQKVRDSGKKPVATTVKAEDEKEQTGKASKQARWKSKKPAKDKKEPLA